ncbi:MAG: NADH-quinone oxidoreductase subunit M [Chloroflexi bacterium]|nr:NADH-quinone oxidoreductase subunit M [Chloroflexota bacterium]
MNPGYLTLIVFVPLLGAIVTALMPKDNIRAIRFSAAGFSFIALVLSAIVWIRYDTALAGMQFVEQATWIPSLGIKYFMGVDGLSLPMVFLTTLLTFLAVLASWNIKLRPKLYFSLLLLLEMGIAGVFTSLDLLLFFLFWEVELIPMYLLIVIWGGQRREYAAIKFVLYTLAGSALMLAGILALYFYADPIVSGRTFDMLELAKTNYTAQYGAAFSSVVFFLLLIGFVIKLPSFPFHTWLPDAHVEAPTAVSVILAGVLLKMGGYAIIRINASILPQALQDWSYLLAGLAVVSVIYGAATSMVQNDMKKMVAYSSVSHMGYVLLGIAALTPTSMNGAVLQMFTHGTITGMLFLLVGVVYDKAHTRLISEFGGLAKRMPLYAALFVTAGLASLGLPGLSGFVAEFTVFVGSYLNPNMQLFTIIAAAGIVITAGYITWMLQRVFFGPLRFGDAIKESEHIQDVRGLEVVPLVTLLAIIIAVGVYPSLVTDLINTGVAPVMTQFVKAGL